MSELGYADPQFLKVKEAFEENLQSGDDLGASCAVTIDGQLVVDLRGGFQDRKKTKVWGEETIVPVYSSGKAIVALLIAGLVDKGFISYDSRVAEVWPDFSQAGKGEITLKQIMSHQGGLCGFPNEIDPRLWIDWDGLCTALAEMEPLWTPGEANGYHPQTYGFLAGEVYRRIAGKTIGQTLAEFYQDRGIDIYCGVPAHEMQCIAPMTKPSRAPDLGEITPLKKAAFLTKWASPTGVSREEWAAAEIPAANMHSNARGLAKFMSIIATGGRLGNEEIISQSGIEKMCAEQCRRDDLILPFNISWANGVMRNTNFVYGPVESAIGHSGFGGSCVLADQENQLSFSFVPNKMSHHLVGDPRSTRLIKAVYDCL